MTDTRRPTDGQDRTRIADLIKRLASDGSELIRQEIRLVRVELAANARRMARGAGGIAAGGGVAVVGVLVLVAFAVIGLGMVLGGEYWLAALIVALVLLGAGGGMVYAGIRGLTRSTLKPEATVATVRETAGWAKQEAGELRARLGGGDGGGGVAGLPAPADLAPGTAIAAVPAEPGATARRPGQEPAPQPAYPTGPKSRPPLSLPLYRRVAKEFSDDDVLGQAAKVAYFMFTSLPPALLVLFALASLYGGDALGDFIAGQLEQVLPGSSEDPNSAAGFIHQFVDQVVQTSAPGPLSIGLLLGVWAASAVFVALSDSLNRTYDVVDDRSWLRRRAIALGVMVGFALLFLAASGILLAGPAIAEALDLFGTASVVWSIVQWPLAFAAVVLAFYLVYYALPDRDQSRCRGPLLKGSAVAAALWLLATFGFRVYISNFGSYGETYGFVGAILVLLLWMYVTSIVILLGGEIASEMERGARA